MTTPPVPTLAQLPLDELLARFASREPAPGGGSASALAGALAATLVQMVGHLTAGKKGFEDASAEAERLVADAATLACDLAGGISADAASFEAVMAAMALPKASDDEKALRRQAMQAAFQGATDVPLAAAKHCLSVGQWGLRMLAIGNPNAASDAGVAVLLAASAGEGCLLNVEINLGAIQDAAWVEARRAEVEPLWADLGRLRAGLWPALRAAGVATPR